VTTTPPVFIAAYTPSPDWSTTTTPKTQAVTANPGDLIAVLGGAQNATTTLSTPTDGTNSYQLQQNSTAAGTCSGYSWSTGGAVTSLAVTTLSLPAGTNGTLYSASLAASGGTGAGYTWSISSGSLPSWATLTASTGAITGTPNATGTTNFTVQVQDSGGNRASKPLGITVNPPVSTNPSWDPSGSWTVAFDDEFTGTTLNPVWQPGWFGASGITPPVNSSSPQNNSAYVTVSGGLLNLKLDASYGALVTTNPSNTGTATGFQIGPPAAFEARINVPGPFGSIRVPNWVAWWTNGQNWPSTGENDILESLGTPDWNCAHVHDNHTDGPGGVGAPGITHNLSPPSGFHTFGAYWTTSSVQFYYDGSSIGSLATDGFTGPHYLILVNTFNGSLDTPTTMQVDWVRVWTPG
jgi:Putative Ig domain/Glycosyl hydrolases family 16